MFNLNKKILFLFFLSLLNNCCKFDVKFRAEKRRICYTSGTFDMFHIGHLKLLQNAKAYCDIIIVGVHPDDVVFANKKKYPIIPYEQRVEILKGIKFVDMVVSDSDYKFSKTQIEKYKVNLFFIGSDYLGRWNDVEKEIKENGADIIYLDYTTSQSSTKLREKLKK